MEEHRPKKLLDQVRACPELTEGMPSASRADAGQRKNYSYRTEQAFAGWIKRYIYFHDVFHPSEMGAAEVEAFLTHLAVKEHVAASTQNQALIALLFLYREALYQEMGPVDALRTNVPSDCLLGTHQLMAKLIYDSGMRLMVMG